MRSTVHRPSAELASIVASFVVAERPVEAPLVGLPRPEIDLVVRYGPAAQGGLDVHARGASERVRRKNVHGVVRTVTTRFRLGAAEPVLGVPASVMAGRVASIEELWGAAEARPLLERLAEARDGLEAVAVLDAAMAARARGAGPEVRPLAREAADRLREGATSVAAIAGGLGVSERHLRRVFRDSFGVGPKTFARIARFDRAVRAARGGRRTGWAGIAASAGYYDQAHLIAEFRAIAGVTPRALLDELAAGRALP